MKKSIIILVVFGLLSAVVTHFLFLWNPFKPLKTAAVTIKNVEREFYYYVPNELMGNPRLLFVLHGSDMYAKTMRMVTGHEFDNLADETKDVIIVYPQGYKKFWNDCRSEASYEAKRQKINDVQFFKEMIVYFSKHYNIDTEHVFAAGFSNGGHMCFKLAKEAPELFKGFAVISANFPVYDNDDCLDVNLPVSMAIFNGTDDPINPFFGGDVNLHDGHRRGKVLSTIESLEVLQRRNHCKSIEGELRTTILNLKNERSVEEYAFHSASNSSKFKLVKINGGGHNVPNPHFFLWPSKLGKVSKAINVPKEIFEFFKDL
jgi:polyhydroxybutyrate depolymerase